MTMPLTPINFSSESMNELLRGTGPLCSLHKVFHFHFNSQIQKISVYHGTPAKEIVDFVCKVFPIPEISTPLLFNDQNNVLVVVSSWAPHNTHFFVQTKGRSTQILKSSNNSVENRKMQFGSETLEEVGVPCSVVRYIGDIEWYEWDQQAGQILVGYSGFCWKALGITRSYAFSELFDVPKKDNTVLYIVIELEMATCCNCTALVSKCVESLPKKRLQNYNPRLRCMIINALVCYNMDESFVLRSMDHPHNCTEGECLLDIAITNRIAIFGNHGSPGCPMLSRNLPRECIIGTKKMKLAAWNLKHSTTWTIKEDETAPAHMLSAIRAEKRRNHQGVN